ncbi:MAG: DUF134 domain-containing protein [Candidatus Jordarchaeum sp.]|uniref:DUF134 domain-containing protein n=1 Tax=Candidatus Jordarchaeum sp. TaxID=2823881 RepID=UPI00404A3E8D
MPRGRGKWRRGRCGRPKIPRCISNPPSVSQLSPTSLSRGEVGLEPIKMFYDEYEVLRLIDYLGLDQEEAGKRMGISRGTVWRLLQSARKKLVSTIVEGKELQLVEDEKIETEV